jgi:hypothetical protein
MVQRPVLDNALKVRGEVKHQVAGSPAGFGEGLNKGLLLAKKSSQVFSPEFSGVFLAGMRCCAKLCLLGEPLRHHASYLHGLGSLLRRFAATMHGHAPRRIPPRLSQYHALVSVTC